MGLRRLRSQLWCGVVCACLCAAVSAAVAPAPESGSEGPEVCAHGALTESACSAVDLESRSDRNDKAMALVQTALSAKRREMSLARQGARAAPAGNGTRGAARLPVCVRSAAGEVDGMPFSVKAMADLEMLHAVGAVEHARVARCEGKTQLGLLSLGEHVSSWTVADKNRLTIKLTVAFLLCCMMLVAWSVWSVVRVPSKDAQPELMENIADDSAAWSQGWMSWLSLSWADDLMGRYGKCFQSVVSDGEILWYGARKGVGSFAPYLNFKAEWDAQVELHKGPTNASLAKCCARVLGVRGVVALVAASVFDLCANMIGMVIVLEKFLNYLVAMSDERERFPDKTQSYLEPSLIIFGGIFGVPMIFRTSAILLTLLDGYFTQVCASGLACVVYEKALLLPAGSAPQKELSEEEDPHGNMNPNVIQILNVDIIACWTGLLRSMINLFLAPILIIIMFVMLVTRIHMAGLIGFLYCIPAMFVTIMIARMNLSFWMAQQGWQDSRLKKLTEAIMHIRALKSLALETLAFTKLNEARQAELSYLQRGAVAGGFIIAVAGSIPWGCVLLALWWILKTDGVIYAVQILIVQRLMGSMLGAIGMWNASIQKFIAVPNSFARIQRFLSQPSRPKNLAQTPSEDQSAPIVHLRGSFTFVREKPPVLKELDVTVGRGQLVGVIGGVASGKSALLQTVISELFPVGDEASIVAPDVMKGGLAYCSQVPWIFEGSLRENVVLGDAFDTERYYQALYAAALTPDLEILPGGDQVAIGSHGIRLSGGQRARVSLARAAYRGSAQVVLMDDPFASVDVQTGQHIFDQLILGPLMSGRTRIVVMQPTPGRLRRLDKVLLLEDGCIVSAGSADEVMAHPAFKRLQEQDVVAQHHPPTKPKVNEATWTFGADMVAQVCERKSDEAGTALRDVEDQDHITFKTVLWWARAAGWHNLFLFFFLTFISRVIDLYQTVAIAMWINQKMTGEADDIYYMLQIIWRTIMAGGTQVLTMYAASRVGVSASRTMHSNVVSALLHAPIDRFFDKQPIGRLINRLSADMRVADDAVPWVFNSMLGFMASFFITEGFILMVLPWQVLLAAVPFFAVALFFAYVYRGTAVPLIFNQKFALSRVHDLQIVCMTSNVSIRANGMLEDFMDRFTEQSSTCIRSAYLSGHVCVAWVQSRIFLCLSVLTAIFSVCGLWSNMEVGTLSIIIVLSNAQLGQFESLSQLLTNALNVLNALERLARYLTIPQEPPSVLASDPIVRVGVTIESQTPLEPRHLQGCDGVGLFIKGESKPLLVPNADGTALVLQEDRRLQELAPSCQELRGCFGCFHISAVNGVSQDAALMMDELCLPQTKLWLECYHRSYCSGLGVRFEKVTAGYNIEKAVLHSINFDIAPRMKVGIAGATGCGKSTTLLCLLRILEVRSGRILVGDLDVSKIGIKLLRTLVGLVPQDATIFEGSWRYNIDPFEEYPDGRVWEALRCAHLMMYVRGLPDGIASKITADGANISFGQRQLLSLARMVIRQPPVLLLDECTSALDPVTQATVQNTVLSAFPMSTVISIAHRVETLLDFDRAIVLDQGKVAEQGMIKELVDKPDGLFAQMVRHCHH